MYVCVCAVGFSGESLQSVEQWLISVEKRVVYVAQEVECRTLMTGLAALFAVYFVFNLKYQPEAEATLEFIQRFTCIILSLTATLLCYRFCSHKDKKCKGGNMYNATSCTHL